jgi:AAA domain, putative AbiEii toxin, Type IV TA system
MSFSISIPTPGGPFAVNVAAGSSVIFVGANGGGKTRLAVLLEEEFKLRAHRISAHRQLTLNPSVPKIGESHALAGLRVGYATAGEAIEYRGNHRWKSDAAVSLLTDYDFLLQALFAEQANKALVTHSNVRRGDRGPADATKFERLVEIWGRLLPHRKLEITGDDIRVSVPGLETSYPGSAMSDGERAIFYMIGQALTASTNSLLIVDEPELHVHRSIMSKLWDELEAARPDCAFAFITHDLEFAAARVAQKFVIRDYLPAPQWTLDAVSKTAGFSEEIATLILGSRRPILFVEGEETKSLDSAIYRCCYPDWTVISRGSCEQVIHSVVTMRRNSELTRVTCAGIVDADDYGPADVQYLQKLGIATLGVSEIENVLLLPAVSAAIGDGEGFVGPELEQRLAALKAEIFDTLRTPDAVEKVVVRYCRRRIDRMLKKIDLSSPDSVIAIAAEYMKRTAELDIAAIAQAARDRINHALQTNDLPLLLAHYDHKALFSLVPKYLKPSRLPDFESWLTRVLRNDRAPALIVALRANLPTITAA